jgi:ankyrin repeat protein
MKRLTSMRMCVVLVSSFLRVLCWSCVGVCRYVDYLPNEPNTNEATYCAAVRPRNMMEDWLETGFDPWAEGREPTSTDFMKHLPGEGGDDGGGGGADADNPFADKRGQLERKLKVEADAKVSDIMDQIISLTRHGRYEEIENILSSSDFVHSVDSRDSKGNTLLMAAAQNGNKRIAKLALRKGADINLRNLTGQTALHFAFSYGYEELGNYLISKGADDSLTNAEGLTCYEGLSLQAIENM